MNFTHKQFAELPFILNIPSDTYMVRVDAQDVPVNVHHNLYAGAAGPIEYPAPVYLGEKTALAATLSGNPTYSLLQLHTVVSTEQVKVSGEADLHVPTQEELVDEFASRIILQRASSNTGDALHAEAREQLKALTPDETHAFRRATALRLTARRLYQHSEGEKFLRAVNVLLRTYMAEIEDCFVEEVTLHQVAGTAIRGIMRITECDGDVVDRVTVVGKIPPIMRQPWFVHSAEKVNLLKTHLATGQEPDAVALLGTRSKGLLERGAYRSAIIEAGAAMETAVARRLVRDMITQGKTPEEAVEFLHNNQRFSDRCKDIMKRVSGKSLPELDNTLWTSVVKHRDDYRHKIAHSDREPSRTDAESVVGDFLKLANVVMTFTP